MNKILTFLFLFLSIGAFAQTETPQVFGSRYYEFKNTVRMDSGLIAPRADTTQIRPSLLAPGFLRWRPQDQRLYIRDSVKFNGFAYMNDIPGSPVDNITIYDSTWLKRRNDQSSVIRLANGNLLCVWTAFDESVSDDDPAYIYGAESSDNGLSWHSYRDIVINFDTTGVYVPSLYKRDNGDVVLLVLTQNSDTTRRIFQLESTNNGTSWGTPVEIYNPVKYLNVAANRLFRASSGRLFYPVQVNQRGGFNSSVGVYEGKVLYSDDEGDNWSVMPYNIVSPDSLMVEAGFFEKNSVLTLYWRSRSGVVYGANSIDNGVTFSTPHLTGILAPNSQTSILVDTLSGNIIAAHNNLSGSINGVSSRTILDISYSEGAGRSWSKGYQIANNSDSTFIEPTLIQVDSSILVIYSSGSALEDNYALRAAKINTEFIYHHSYSLGNTHIRNQDTSFQPAYIRIGGTITSGAISSAAHSITATGAAPQFRIIRSEATNQGLAITAGQGNAILHSYEGTGSVFGRFIFRSSRGTDTLEQARIHNNGFLGVGTATPISTIHSAGSFAVGIVSTGVNLTLTATHHTVRLTATGLTITLPTAASSFATGSGRIYCIINGNAGTSTISSYTGLSGVSTTIPANTALWLQSDGTNWYQIK